MTVRSASPNATDGQSQRLLSARLGIHRNAMVTVIDNLERRGLAKRLPHPDDRRAVAATLTAKARRLLPDLDEQGPTRSKTRSARHCRTASATPRGTCCSALPPEPG